MILLKMLLTFQMNGPIAGPCSPADAQHAEAAIHAIDNWQAIDMGYRQFGHCDDGAVAQGFDDRVITELSQRWQALPQGAALIARDADFRKFVLRHIGASTDVDALKHVVSLAQTQCPTTLASLCKDIGTNAAEAIKQADAPAAQAAP